MSTATITMYSKPNCVQCDATERAFEKKGIAYDKVDLTKDHEAMAKVQSLGYRQVPVIVAGEQHWAGFQPGMISTLTA